MENVRVLTAKVHDLGGFEVRRLLPSAAQRNVGPFVFFDHMGPAVFPAGAGVDVRPHPHIGLATVTYLFEGALLHRDSLGMVQKIVPGDVNWMTAGRGIVHSERSPMEVRAAPHPLHGLQTWLALPRVAEESAPAFYHHPAANLPRFARDDAEIALILGTAYGERSPVAVFTPTTYFIARFARAGRLIIDAEHAERAVYPVQGDLRIDGLPVAQRTMALLPPVREMVIEAMAGAVVAVCGGAPLDGPRRIWWNFVSSSPERIEQAKADWLAGRFAPVPGET